MRKWYFLILFTHLLLASNVQAQNPVASNYKRPYYIGFALGGFSPEDNPNKLTKRKVGNGLGLNAGYYLNNYLSVESGLSFFHRRLHRELGPVVPGLGSNSIVFYTIGLSVSAAVSYPIWKLKPFLGSGIGIYSTGLSTRATNAKKSGSGPRPGDQSSLGHHFYAGISTMLWNRRSVIPIYLDLVWKHVVFDVDFKEFTNGQVELGGDWVYVSLRFGGY